jgi:hypothetical protein
VVIHFPMQGRFPFKQGWSPLRDKAGAIPHNAVSAKFRVGDDPGVGGRNQKDVWRLAKFFSLASAVTRGALPALLFVILSLSKCEVFRGAKCMEQLRRERAASR